LLSTFKPTNKAVIYGPVKTGGKWRIRNNEEIDNIIRKKDIVRFVKARNDKLDRSRRKNGGQ
jgi:hypothetical protein